MTKPLEQMTTTEIKDKVREINMHRLHAVRHHAHYQEFLYQKAKMYWEEYSERLKG